MDISTGYRVISYFSNNEKIGINFSKFNLTLEDTNGLNKNDMIAFNLRDGQYLSISSIEENIIEVGIITYDRDEYFIGNPTNEYFYKLIPSIGLYNEDVKSIEII